jgi:hypothetical protein
MTSTKSQGRKKQHLQCVHKGEGMRGSGNVCQGREVKFKGDKLVEYKHAWSFERPRPSISIGGSKS